MVLAALDWLLTALHVAVIVGFVVLWLPPATVRIHRWLVGLTAFSWLVIGYFFGFGYCFLTDWHWQIKRARGITDLPGSFLKYAGDYATGADLPASTVDTVAASVFVGGCAAALFRYLSGRRKAKDRASRSGVAPPVCEPR